MKILKIGVLSQETGALIQYDAIEHEGKFWLVPEWNVFPAERVQKPARIVCLDGLELQSAGPKYPIDYWLNTILPKAVLEGRQKVESLVVVEAPDLSIPLPPEAMN